PPTLETTRLRLRAHQTDDFEDVARLWADPAVVRHISGTPSTEAESWWRLLRYTGHWHHLGFGYWAIEDRKTSRFLGEAGLAHYKRNLDVACRDMPEAGWVFAQDAWGHGYAHEAMSAILAWADRTLDATSTWCFISEEHAASLRLATRLGFHETQRSRVMESPVVILQRARRKTAP
ncbi:MAG: GNAT family N-acetyltransferase, partial [Pseudomonadota bacterium]